MSLGVVRGQSNGSSSITQVMGDCWRQDEHQKKKLVREGEDETDDKVEIMDEMGKLGMVVEDKQKYIDKEVERMAKMVLNKEELNGEARDTNDANGDTISES